MTYQPEKAELICELYTDSLRSLTAYLTRDFTLFQLEELIESSRWQNALSESLQAGRRQD
jgi:hypothetical protein